MTAGPPPSAGEGDRVRHLAARACLGGLVVLSLVFAAWPSILNGFPLLYDDSNVYLGFPNTALAPFPPYYSALVWVISKLAGLRAVILLQALGTVVILWLALMRLTRGKAFAIVLGAIAVLALTHLPWLVSWVTTDFLGGLGALALMMLTLPPGRALEGTDALFAATVFLACVAATANVLTLLPFAILCLFVRRLICGQAHIGRRGWLVLALLPICFALPFTSNLAINHTPNLAAGSSTRLFSKLVDKGLAQPYLARTCPTQNLPACAYLPEIEAFTDAEQFMWGKEGAPALADLSGAWQDRSGAYAALCARIIAAYPAQAAGIALHDTVELLGRLSFASYEREMIPLTAEDDPVRLRIARSYPGLEAGFLKARQQRGALREVYPQRFYEASTLVGYALLAVLLLIALVRRDRLLIGLALATFFLLVWSAFVHGGLATTVPRYNLKVSWLPWLVVIAGVIRLSDRAGRTAKGRAQPSFAKASEGILLRLIRKDLSCEAPQERAYQRRRLAKAWPEPDFR